MLDLFVVTDTQSMPKYTRVHVERSSSSSSSSLKPMRSPSTTVGWFPTSPLLSYSRLARSQCHPNPTVELVRNERVTVITLPLQEPGLEWLPYILRFLQTIPKYAKTPQIRYPGMFNFVQAVMLYRNVLAMKLPWGQWMLQGHLLEYISHYQLTAKEFILVWESFPSDDVLVVEMLREFVSHLKSKTYDKKEVQMIKRYCRARPGLLKALDESGKFNGSRRGIGGRDLEMVNAQIQWRRRNMIVKGLLPLEQGFLRWVTGGGRKIRY